MTYYEKKRKQSGLSKMDMARELNINYGRYIAIEKGNVKMPSNLIDKFNEIINRGTQNKITSMENNRTADNFWKEISSKDENGVYVLYQKMDAFNISGIKELTKLMNYKSTGTFYNYLSGKSIPNDEFKKRVYDFFSNELNIQIPTENKKKDKRNIRGVRNNKPGVVHDKELSKYYKDTDFKSLLQELGMTCTSLGREIGISASIMSRMCNKVSRPSDKTLQRVKECLESKMQTTVDFSELIEVPEQDIEDEKELKKEESEPSVVRRYQDELSEIDEILEMYEEKVRDLKIRKKICVEVLEAINELRQVEE